MSVVLHIHICYYAFFIIIENFCLHHKIKKMSYKLDILIFSPPVFRRECSEIKGLRDIILHLCIMYIILHLCIMYLYIFYLGYF